MTKKLKLQINNFRNIKIAQKYFYCVPVKYDCIRRGGNSI